MRAAFSSIGSSSATLPRSSGTRSRRFPTGGGLARGLRRCGSPQGFGRCCLGSSDERSQPRWRLAPRTLHPVRTQSLEWELDAFQRAGQQDLFAIAVHLTAARGRPFDWPRIEVESVERLLLHDWRANIRELSAALDRIAAISQGSGLPLWAIQQVLGATRVATTGTLTRAGVEEALASCGVELCSRLAGRTENGLKHGVGGADRVAHGFANDALALPTRWPTRPRLGRPQNV
jgi:hypothetical protein